MSRHEHLDEAALAALVDRFYDRVQADAVLGPVFNPVVHDWDAHKRLLTDFWASVVLRAGSYRGNPMAAHRALPQVRAEHFEHWLALWAATTAEVLGAAAAAQMQGYAARIGTGLRMGLGLAPVSGRGLGVPLVNAPR
ncbi:MAG: group III truncated hemoglobin [Lysobacterales bacterium]